MAIRPESEGGDERGYRGNICGEPMVFVSTTELRQLEQAAREHRLQRARRHVYQLEQSIRRRRARHKLSVFLAVIAGAVMAYPIAWVLSRVIIAALRGGK